MKIKLTFLILFAFTQLIFSQEGNNNLTNEKIIELSNSGLSKTIIISKIENSTKYSFDTTTEGLVNLSKNSVDDDIVILMINKQKEFKENSLLIGNILINKPGLYTIINDQKLVEIKSHTSDPLGVSGFKIKIQIKEPSSNLTISDNQKVFYYYAKEQSTKSDNSFIVSNTGNPNEATLIKFKEKRKERELEVGKIKMAGVKISIPKKNNVLFKVEEIKPNIYKIIVNDKLENGEYAFIFGAILAGVSTKVFDFSVK